MSDGLMAIGAFSRASSLSIKALRAYHEAGILVPADVDPRTGYRTYHAAQLIDAAILCRLRRLHLPLTQVREILQARDPQVTRRVLARHELVMRERLDEVVRVVAELADGVDRPEAHTPVHVRDVPASHTLACRGRVPEPDFGVFFDAAYAQLEAVAARADATPAGPPGALYSPEIHDEEAEDVEAYLPLAAPVALPEQRAAAAPAVFLGELPAVTVAVLVHVGPYETIGEAYRRLGGWVAHHAVSAGQQVREVYLVSVGDTDDPKQFRTEIHWPIVKDAAT